MIERSVGDYRGDGAVFERWLIRGECEDPDGIVAGLWVDLDSRQVMQVETVRSRRGQGLARRLWEAATAVTEVVHAPSSHRTVQGEAFAVAVGGPAGQCLFGCCSSEEE